MSLLKSIDKGAGLVLACLSITVAAPVFAQSGADHSTADAALKQKVMEAINSDKALYAKHITVSVKDGVVHLGGFVAEPAEIKLAKNDAEHVPGVKTVDNQMTVKAGSSEAPTSH